MNCKNCGNNLEPNSAFCKTCGQAVTKEEVLINNNASKGEPYLNSESSLNRTEAVNLNGQTINNGANLINLTNTLENVNNASSQFVQTNEEASNIQANTSLMGNNDGSELLSVNNQQQNAPYQNGVIINEQSSQLQNQLGSTYEIQNQPSAINQMPMDQNQNQTNVMMQGQNNQYQNQFPEQQSFVENQGNINGFPNSSANVSYNSLNNNGIPNQNKNNKKTFIILACGLGAVIIVLIALIASGGINFKFTFSSAKEITNNKNQTIDNGSEEKTTNKTKEITTKSTTRATTVSPTSNEEYKDFSDISVYIPETFEYTYDNVNHMFMFKSKTKKQTFSLTFYNAPYEEITASVSQLEQSLISQGTIVTDKGTNTYKNIEYTYLKYTIEGYSITTVIREFSDIGTIVSNFFTDFSPEESYLETLDIIATKSKINDRNNFSPESNNILQGKENIKFIKPNTSDFE